MNCRVSGMPTYELWRIDLNGYDVIDIVGTSGDGKNVQHFHWRACIICRHWQKSPNMETMALKHQRSFECHGAVSSRLER